MMENLGYRNGWPKTPDIVVNCREENHKIEVESLGRCLTKTTCKECGYFYKTDSGD